MQTMEQLLSQPEQNRGLDWEDRFLLELTESKLQVVSSDPITGPDGWPYLVTRLSAEGTEPAQKILQWLSLRGMGLLVFGPDLGKEEPEFLLTYGMIWNFRETGVFLSRNQNNLPSSGAVQFSLSQLVHAGTPTEKYLPGYVRQILREFFLDQGILRPKILLVSQDRKHYDLAISLDSLGNPPQNEHASIAEAISWFLPSHYSIILIAESGMPVFGDL